MPRRTKPDRLSRAVGHRIRQLREEVGLTMEKLAWESEVNPRTGQPALSKGHLSNLEKGLARPTTHTLKMIADALGVLPLDLLTFPSRDTRQALVDLTRNLSSRELAQLSKAAQSAQLRRKA